MAFGGGDSPDRVTPLGDAIQNHILSVKTSGIGRTTNAGAANLERRTLLQKTFGADFTENGFTAEQSRQRKKEQDDLEKQQAENTGTGSGSGGRSLLSTL